MKRFTVLLALVAIAGCHDAYSNFNIVYLKSLPRGLRVEVPGEAMDRTASALRASQFDGQPAKFHQDSVGGAQEVNQTVLEIFKFVDEIVEAVEPVAEEENVRYWGPIPIDDSQELALLISRTETSTVMQVMDDRPPVETDEYFDFALLLRPIGGSDADWKLIFGGRSVVIEDTPVGVGSIVLDVGIVSNGDAQGLMFIAYDSRDGQSAIDVAWDADRATMKFDAEAAWRFRLAPDKSGKFFLLVKQDIGGTPALETTAIASRWSATLAGRADVRVFGGDLGIFVGIASECWDEVFTRTYFFSNVEELEPMNEGTPQDCAEGFRESNFGD